MKEKSSWEGEYANGLTQNGGWESRHQQQRSGVPKTDMFFN
jgi:hypothetical protein